MAHYKRTNLLDDIVDKVQISHHTAAAAFGDTFMAMVGLTIPLHDVPSFSSSRKRITDGGDNAAPNARHFAMDLITHLVKHNKVDSLTAYAMMPDFGQIGGLLKTFQLRTQAMSDKSHHYNAAVRRVEEEVRFGYSDVNSEEDD